MWIFEKFGQMAKDVDALDEADYFADFVVNERPFVDELFCAALLTR